MSHKIEKPPFEIPPELLKAWPDHKKLKNEIIWQYERSAGTKLDSPSPTREQQKSVLVWLNENTEKLILYFHRRSSAFVPKFSPCLSDKISRLAQYNCPICQVEEGLFPVLSIPIRISPESKQALAKKPKRTAAFEKAIRHRLLTHPTSFPPHQSICLMIVFVVKTKSAQKDVDNMAKALIDAVKGVIFGDDRKIDHLNVLRIHSPDEEYIYLNIRPTQINEHHDVFYPYSFHSWAGADELNIGDFI